MFESRSLICKIGFFDPLIDSIVCLIYKNVLSSNINNVTQMYTSGELVDKIIESQKKSIYILEKLKELIQR